MRTPIRSLLFLSLLAVVLAACGTTAGTPAESTPPSSAPSDPPSESPDATPEVDGTITFVDGVAVGGSGGSIANALAAGSDEPMLVNGVFYMDTDGNLYLADSLTDASVPTFGGPILEVLNYPDSPDTWDMANAEVTGLQEANGVRYFENNQLFGVVAP